jgi:hypothetical protein
LILFHDVFRQGDAQVIGHLQAQLKNELTAHIPYFGHCARQRWGG